MLKVASSLLHVCCFLLLISTARASDDSCESLLTNACQQLECLSDPNLGAEDRIAAIEKGAETLLRYQKKQPLSFGLGPLKDQLEKMSEAEQAYLRNLLNLEDAAPPVKEPQQLSSAAVASANHAYLKPAAVPIVGNDKFRVAHTRLSPNKADHLKIITALIFEGHDSALTSYELPKSEHIIAISSIHQIAGSPNLMMLAQTKDSTKIYLIDEKLNTAPVAALKAKNLQIAFEGKAEVILQNDGPTRKIEKLFRPHYDSETKLTTFESIDANSKFEIPPDAYRIFENTKEAPILYSPIEAQFYWLDDDGVLQTSKCPFQGDPENIAFEKISDHQVLILLTTNDPMDNEESDPMTELAILDLKTHVTQDLAVPKEEDTMYHELDPQLIAVSGGNFVFKFYRIVNTEDHGIIREREWMLFNPRELSFTQLMTYYEAHTLLDGGKGILFYGDQADEIKADDMGRYIDLSDVSNYQDTYFERDVNPTPFTFMWDTQGVLQFSTVTAKLERILSVRLNDLAVVNIDRTTSLLFADVLDPHERQAVYLFSNRNPESPTVVQIALNTRRDNWFPSSTQVQELSSGKILVQVEGRTPDLFGHGKPHLTTDLYLLDATLSQATALLSIDEIFKDEPQNTEVHLVAGTLFVYQLQKNHLEWFRLDTDSNELVSIKVPEIDKKTKVFYVDDSHISRDGTVSVATEHGVEVIKVK